jgi:hypothetical protein
MLLGMVSLHDVIGCVFAQLIFQLCDNAPDASYVKADMLAYERVFRAADASGLFIPCGWGQAIVGAYLSHNSLMDNLII